MLYFIDQPAAINRSAHALWVRLVFGYISISILQHIQNHVYVQFVDFLLFCKLKAIYYYLHLKLF